MNEILKEMNGSNLVIKLNRPAKKNALTINMYQKLTDLLAEAQNDSSIKSVVFCSTSDTFSAGNDLIDFRDNPPIADDAPVYKFVRCVANFNKPLIAAVDGLAVGIGLTLLLHCDFVVITEKAKLMSPFVNLGLVPEFGSSKLLVDLVGLRRASNVFILGEQISGKQAVEYGIASFLASKEDVVAQALNVAQKISSKPIDALYASRELIRPKNDLLRIIEDEIECFKNQVQSINAKEAINAILEKRKPIFNHPQ